MDNKIGMYWQSKSPIFLLLINGFYKAVKYVYASAYLNDNSIFII